MAEIMKAFIPFIPFILSSALILSTPLIQAQAPSLADSVAKELRERPMVRASFVQTRQIAALKRPLVSRGHFIFSKERGMVWEIQQPINITYVLQASGTTEIAADGRVRRQSGREAQGMNEVGRILSALWSGSPAVLEPLFQTRMQGRMEQWTLKLLPKNAPLSDFLASVVVDGGAAGVQRVQVLEASGDMMTIIFQTELQAAPLSAQELRLFDAKP
jgi:hypothetical protein